MKCHLRDEFIKSNQEPQTKKGLTGQDDLTGSSCIISHVTSHIFSLVYLLGCLATSCLNIISAKLNLCVSHLLSI